jgi:hypothetical protein
MRIADLYLHSDYEAFSGRIFPWNAATENQMDVSSASRTIGGSVVVTASQYPNQACQYPQTVPSESHESGE